MSKESTAILTAVQEALEVAAELPLRVYHINILRMEDGKSKIKLTTPTITIEVSGKHGKRIKVDNMFLHITENGLQYQIAKCPDYWSLNVPGCFKSQLEPADSKDLKWDPLDDKYESSPSAELVKLLDRSIVNVAERILTRFSRVDLL